ncbi:MAG: hypothetical protein JXQ73_00040 [Phycisphaerae bacterium]|nr:hypothetical protein [Phycisphaerae bacterium]
MTTNQRRIIIPAFAAVLLTSAYALMAAEGKKPAPPKKEAATFVGKVVDLYTFMAGSTADKGKAKSSAQLIRSGVPAGLETDKGLLVLGTGRAVSPRVIANHAGKQVELTGKLYEKSGLKYLDVTGIASEKGKATKSSSTAKPKAGAAKSKSGGEKKQ